MSKDKFIEMLRINFIILYYAIQLVLIFFYSKTEVQPFVYVRF